MSRKSYPNVNAANQYARDVVRGKIVACQFVIQACQRHLDDLMAEKSKSFRYRFDKDLAERAAKFIQLLPHTKGEWAFKRMPITLEPWQLFVICCAFGWVNKGTRLRRFREVYTEIPRKNGKSAISAGVALYCFACDNEFGAEVYSGATTEKQAWEVFRPARLMCKRTPMLTEAFGIEVNASNMNRPEDGARFEPLIGNPGDGSSPHCAVVDEYHEHATDALYTTMLTGMGARRQPLMWAITTAGYNIEGPCYDKRREVIEMLNGSVILVTPVNGLPSSGVADTLTGGFDTEELETWRARVIERYYWTPQGGADGDYVVWAKEVPGITRAWTYRHWMGTGTVGVMIAGSDLINPIPEESTETAARQHIEPLAPVAGSDLYVFRPVAHTVDFHIRVTPDTPEIRAAITAELRSFLLRDGYPQGELKVSRISEAISGANGEYSHQLLAPADNISIAKNELAVLGTISWT
ncbi:terminase large subunit [Escherichia coli]|uniref:terminase large subunit domain-containing protein n=8 Tax=Escherichia coli TaxID=562 RepID=UPI00301D735A